MIRIIKRVCIIKKSTNKSKNIKLSIIGAKLSKRSDIFNWGQIVHNWDIIVRIKYKDYIYYPFLATNSEKFSVFGKNMPKFSVFMIKTPLDWVRLPPFWQNTKKKTHFFLIRKFRILRDPPPPFWSFSVKKQFFLCLPLSLVT